VNLARIRAEPLWFRLLVVGLALAELVAISAIASGGPP